MKQVQQRVTAVGRAARAINGLARYPHAGEGARHASGKALNSYGKTVGATDSHRADTLCTLWGMKSMKGASKSAPTSNTCRSCFRLVP